MERKATKVNDNSECVLEVQIRTNDDNDVVVDDKSEDILHHFSGPSLPRLSRSAL